MRELSASMGLAALWLAAGCTADEAVRAPVTGGACTSTTREVSGPIVHTTTVEYDASGRVVVLAEVLQEGGIETYRRVDENGYVDGRLVSHTTTVSGPGAESSAYEVRFELYTYDAEGRRVEEVVHWDGEPIVTNRSSYDTEGQLAVVESLGADGTEQTTTFFEWADGRQTRQEVWSDGELEYIENRFYHREAPDLDVDVFTYTGGFGGLDHTLFHDGEQLVEKHYELGPLAGAVVQWSWRDDGQVASSTLRYSNGARDVTTYTYDEQGHLLRRETGPDLDGDGRHDSVRHERTWTWRCYGSG